MNYRKFGRSGWQVSDMAHGLWGMGGWSGSEDKQSLEALQLAVEIFAHAHGLAELLRRTGRGRPGLARRIGTERAARTGAARRTRAARFAGAARHSAGALPAVARRAATRAATRSARGFASASAARAGSAAAGRAALRDRAARNAGARAAAVCAVTGAAAGEHEKRKREPSSLAEFNHFTSVAGARRELCRTSDHL